MSHSVRHVLLTRLCILGLVVLAGWMFSGRLIELATAATLRQMTGHDWRFRVAAADIRKGRLTLDRLSIDGDDSGPGVAASATADVASWGILDGRLVINRLQVSGLRWPIIDQLVTPDVQQLPGDPVARSDQERRRREAGRAWLDSLVTSPDWPKVHQLSVAQDEVSERWNETAARLGQLSSEWELLVADVQSADTEPGPDNPLRTGTLLASFRQKAGKLQPLARRAREEIDLIERQLADDLQQLAAAKAGDLALVDRASGSGALTGRADLATAMLVEGRHERVVRNVAEWAASLSRALQLPASPEWPVHAGRRVIFDGSRLRSPWLVRELEAAGVSRPGGQRFEYAISLHNLSGNVEADQTSVRFMFRSQGPVHVLAEGEIRPSGDGQMTVSIPGLSTGGEVLGDGQHISLTTAPGTMDASFLFSLTRDGIHGRAELVESAGPWQLDMLHSMVAHAVAPESVSGELALTGPPPIVLQIDGRGDYMNVQVEEGPGPWLMSALGSAATRTSAARAAGERVALEGLHDQAVSRCREVAATLRSRLEQILAGERAILGSIERSADRPEPGRLR